MRNLLFAFVILALAFPILAAAETWNNAALADVMCSAKAKDNPDAHTTQCALNCADSGFGIFTADGAFLKFDDAGNKKALAALKATKKEKAIRATVTGDKAGDLIKVASLKID
jgi:hypothetical protein